MYNLIRKINKIQLKDEDAKIYKFPNVDTGDLKDERKAWHKDTSVIEKVKKVQEKQAKEQKPKKANPGKFKAGNKYIAKPKQKPAAQTVKAPEPKPGRAPKVGLKRKGRLPSKMIVNKLGRRQTVYYRPDKKTKSMYIQPDKLSTGEMMDNYKESFKRMLFLDHDDVQNQRRAKGADNHAQGADMVNKLDNLADKYGFSFENFDQSQDKLIKGEFQGLDKFLEEAEQIYGEMYKVGDRPALDFLAGIFNVTKQKLHTKHNRKKIEEALNAQGIVPIINIKNNNTVRNPASSNKFVKPSAPKASASQNDDDDEKDKDSSERNVASVINDPTMVNNVNAFLKKYKI